MKKKILSAGIIGMTLAIVLIIVACTTYTADGYKTGTIITDPKTENFEGSWRYIDIGVDVAYSFSGSDFILKNLLENSSISGTYSFTAKTITFTAGDDTWTQQFIIRVLPYRKYNKEVHYGVSKTFYYLNLDSDENSHVFGRFTKE